MMRTNKAFSGSKPDLHQMLQPSQLSPHQKDQPPKPTLLMEFKARQSAKIKEVGEALIADGFCVLDQQAKALGLSRSTTWTILKASHKSSGLSAAVINRMLSSPQLPPRARLKIFEYIREKSAGHYGDSQRKIGKFTARISPNFMRRGLKVDLQGKRPPLFSFAHPEWRGTTTNLDARRVSDKAALAEECSSRSSWVASEPVD